MHACQSIPRISRLQAIDDDYREGESGLEIVRGCAVLLCQNWPIKFSKDYIHT